MMTRRVRHTTVAKNGREVTGGIPRRGRRRTEGGCCGSTGVHGKSGCRGQCGRRLRGSRPEGPEMGGAWRRILAGAILLCEGPRQREPPASPSTMSAAPPSTPSSSRVAPTARSLPEPGSLSTAAWSCSGPPASRPLPTPTGPPDRGPLADGSTILPGVISAQLATPATSVSLTALDGPARPDPADALGLRHNRRLAGQQLVSGRGGFRRSSGFLGTLAVSVGRHRPLHGRILPGEGGDRLRHRQRDHRPDGHPGARVSSWPHARRSNGLH